MARSLANFLVGIVWDKDDFDKGTRDIERSFDGIKSVGTKLGTVLAGAMGAAALSVISTAHAMDNLNISMHNADASTQYIYNMGNALERFGGNAQDALTEYKRLQTAVDQFQKLGKADLYTSLAAVGIDVSWADQVKNAEDLQKRLADIISTSTPQQRRMIQEVTGFSNATMLLYERGSKGLDDQLAKSQNLTGSVDALTQKSREFNEQWAEAGQNLEHFQNVLADKTLKSLTEAVKKTNEWVEANQQLQGKAIDTGIDIVKQNPATITATAATGGASAISSVLGKLGLGGAGGWLSRLSEPAMLAGFMYDQYGATVKDIEKARRGETGTESIPGAFNAGLRYLFMPTKESIPAQQYPLLSSQETTSPYASSPDYGAGYSLWDKTKTFFTPEKESPARDTTSRDASQIPGNIYGAPSLLDYSPSPIMNTYNAKQQANLTGEAMADSLRRNPLKIEATFNSQLNLDGRVINEQIDKRIYEHNQNTADAFESTTAR